MKHFDNPDLLGIEFVAKTLGKSAENLDFIQASQLHNDPKYGLVGLKVCDPVTNLVYHVSFVNWQRYEIEAITLNGYPLNEKLYCCSCSQRFDPFETDSYPSGWQCLKCHKK